MVSLQLNNRKRGGQSSRVDIINKHQLSFIIHISPYTVYIYIYIHIISLYSLKFWTRWPAFSAAPAWRLSAWCSQGLIDAKPLSAVPWFPHVSCTPQGPQQGPKRALDLAQWWVKQYEWIAGDIVEYLLVYAHISPVKKHIVLPIWRF